MGGLKDVKLGDRVLACNRYVGRVQFIGEVDQSTYLGLSLDKPVGNSSGEFRGKKYFDVEPGHGYFVLLKSVAKYNTQLVAALRIQSFVRCLCAKKVMRKRRNTRAWNSLDNQNELLTIERAKAVLPVGIRKKIRDLGRAKLFTEKVKESAPSEGSEFDTVAIPPQYNGLKVSFPFTLDSLISIMEYFKKGGVLHYNYVSRILSETYTIYKTSPNLQEIGIPEGVRFTVVGDLHGQLEDLFTIFSLNGLPSPTNRYFFNGDFVDRGQFGVEICCVLFGFKMLYPGFVFHNRGNHESRAQNTYMGFEDEVLEKYDGSSEKDPTRGRRLLNLFQIVFDQLPLAAIVQEKIFINHGGLLGPEVVNLSQINTIDPGFENRLYEALLWSDPRPSGNYPEAFTGCKKSDRGAGVEFGVDITNSFCSENRLALLIRSHECVPEGYEVIHKGRVITLFSASCYCGVMTNKGAFITFGIELQPEIQQYYAQNLMDSSFTQKLMEQKQQKLEEETLNRIKERIVDEKANLYWFFNQSDSKKTGKVTKVEWATAMRSVIGLDIPYLGLCSKLADVDSENKINYNEFLNRYQIQINTLGEDWQSNILDQVCKKLFVVCSDIQGAFRAFDTNGDGLIDYNEFWGLLKSLDLGLSNQQIYDLMQHCDVDQSNSINYEEFVKRFQVSFESVKGGFQSSKAALNEPAVREKLNKIGHALLSKHKSIDAAFTTADSDHDGCISKDAFLTILRSLKLVHAPGELEQLVSLICPSPDGIINFRDFMDAFQVRDVKGKEWASGLMQQIASVLYQYRIQLRSAFRLFDLNNDGHISEDEFYVAVTNMNLHLDKPLTKEQVAEIMTRLDKDGNGSLDYREFIEGFKVVDTKKRK